MYYISISELFVAKVCDKTREDPFSYAREKFLLKLGLMSVK